LSRKKKIFMIVMMTAALGIFVISGFIGRYVFTASTLMRDNEETSLEVIEDWLQEKEYFDLARFRSEYDIERMEIDSSHGEHTIPADLIMADEERDNDTVIMVHGLGWKSPLRLSSG